MPSHLLSLTDGPSILLDKKNSENNWIYRLPSLPVAREEWEKKDDQK